MSFVVAIDGPAASGKGTLARRIAAQYGFHHLDTGLTYRAVARAMLDAGASLDDEEAAAELAENLDLSGLDRDVLSAHEVGEAASRVAVMSKVRAALKRAQQQFARKSPGAVLDGRDIGTVICPDADIKFYVTASDAVRARRRHAEMAAKGAAAAYDAVLADLRRRDARDSERADSPMRPAHDAYLLDTTEMDIEAAFAAAQCLIEKAIAAKN
ncbi:(d)CMP kinase [Hoeflea sp. WL0058]|uniref:Cytidylate kinase n=1 Tax=Flavimaribacter sediminis TaxID=2865987 RepID=A0AAE2ZNT0_9HYPH|nr:(d)CMP kinase [Flavimaribacter sediminis]